MEKKTTAAAATAMEKFFESKRRIVDQLRQQDQQFDGIPRPPLLLPQPHPSDPFGNSSHHPPQPVDCRSGSMGCMIASDRSTEPIASVLQPLCVDESVKRGSYEKYGAQVLDSSLKSDNRALVESPSIPSIIEDSRGTQKNSSGHCGSITRSQCSTRPYCEDELLNLADSCSFGRDATILIEEVSHVDTAGKSEEGSRKQEPQLEFCHLPPMPVVERFFVQSGDEDSCLIPELPCVSEEIEIRDEATGTSAKEISLAGPVKRQALAAIPEDHSCPASVSELESGRYSLMRDSKAILRRAGDTKLPMETLPNSVSQAKTSLQRDGLCTSVKVVKRGNIVTNMRSFLPSLQQKQAAVALTGKRDIKVKALEAADAARRQAEKREAERKMKKEALKLERARMEQENIRLLELEKKRKEEEKKKKEAEIASRKRLREEEERREKDRKRKRVEDARKHQELQKDKLCSKKEEKQIRKKAMIADDKKDANLKILSENKGAKIQGSETVPEDGSLVPETPRHCSDNLRVTSFFNQGKIESFKEDEIKEQSYDISPYQCSDDEDEDEDDNAPRKFIPSWASKNRIALAISSQNSVDPDLIFARDSFCSIDEVVLPRKLRLK